MIGMQIDSGLLHFKGVPRLLRCFSRTVLILTRVDAGVNAGFHPTEHKPILCVS